MIPALLLSLALAAQTPPAVTTERLADAYLLYIEGRTLSGNGNLSGAIEKYKQALELLPSAEIQAELAGAYAEQGDLSAAESEAGRALTLDPANRSAHRLIGLIEASRAQRAGRTADASLVASATTHLEQASAPPARDLIVMLTLGELYLRAGDHARAIHTLQQFLIDRPDFPQAVLLLAEAYRAAGQPEAARALVEGSGAGRDNTPEGRVRAAEALERRGEWLAAADAWSTVLEDDPRNTNARMRYAAALVNGGEMARGRGELLALVRDEPADITAWHLLTQVELKGGRLDEAEAAARQIERIDPADSRGPLAVADVLAERGNYAGVVAVLDRRVTSPLDTDVASGAFVDMAVRLGEAWMEVGNAKRARATLEMARRRAPDEIHLAFVLASVYERSGEIGDAERTFREVIAADPEHAPALNYLGYMLAERGRKLPEAVTLVERALAVDADNPAYLDSLGWAYFKLGRFADAIAPLERAAAGAPDSSVIQDHLGDAYLRMDRFDEAAAAFERALGGDRDGIDIDALTKKRDRARKSAGQR